MNETEADVSPARLSADQMNAIIDLDFTPAVASHLYSVLSARIARSPWGHFPEAKAAMQYGDDAADVLAEVPLE